MLKFVSLCLCVVFSEGDEVNVVIEMANDMTSKYVSLR